MTDDHLRIGDAEREQAAGAQGAPYPPGRRSAAAPAARGARVWAARPPPARGPVFRDLPGRSGPAAPASPGPARRPAYRCGGMALSRHGLPTPIIVVLAVLLVLTVLTHLPLIVAGVLVAFFVLSRRRGPARARHWSR